MSPQGAGAGGFGASSKSARPILSASGEQNVAARKSRSLLTMPFIAAVVK